MRYRRNHKNGPSFELHAESACINKAIKNFSSVEGMELYVVRFSGLGLPVCSKPCDSCMKYMKRYKISKVHFINHNGEWDYLNLRD